MATKSDSRALRLELPFLFTNLKRGEGLPEALRWLEAEMQTPRRSIIGAHAPCSISAARALS
jgi:hypothetical protein